MACHAMHEIHNPQSTIHNSTIHNLQFQTTSNHFKHTYLTFCPPSLLQVKVSVLERELLADLMLALEFAPDFEEGCSPSARLSRWEPACHWNLLLVVISATSSIACNCRLRMSVFVFVGGFVFFLFLFVANARFRLLWVGRKWAMPKLPEEWRCYIGRMRGWQKQQTKNTKKLCNKCHNTELLKPIARGVVTSS